MLRALQEAAKIVVYAKQFIKKSIIICQIIVATYTQVRIILSTYKSPEYFSIYAVGTFVLICHPHKVYNTGPRVIVGEA